MNKKIIFFILLGFILIGLSPAWSAAPIVAPLGSYNDSFYSPIRISTDTSGRIYVSDIRTISVLSNAGTHLFTLPVSYSGKGFLGVAVDKAGNIYVGSTGFVRVYDPSGNYLKDLGLGVVNFVTPSDIAIDSTSGLIYVVDNERNTVFIFNPDGSLNNSFDGGIIAPLNLPTGIAIDESQVPHRILIADHPIVKDVWGQPSNSCIVKAFDLQGNYIGSIGSYGTGDGRFKKIQGLTVDRFGRVYVADTYQKVVQVFESNGQFLTKIGSPGDGLGQLLLPSDVVIDSNNRLLVPDAYNRRVEIFGLDNYYGMGISPTSLTFNATQGQGSPPSQSLTIANLGNVNLNWGATANTSWLGISPNGGILSTLASAISSVSVNISGLKAGKYSGTITVVNNDTLVLEAVPVTLNIAPPPPTLSVTPASLNFTAQKGGNNPAAQSIIIANTGGGTLSWTAQTDQSWLSINLKSGTAPSTISVSINAKGLALGTFTGNVTVTAPGAVRSPASVGVTLKVISAGNISVNINPAGLSSTTFTIKGPSNYTGSGTSWTQTDAPAGDYTITYGEVPGYKKPVSEKNTMVSGSSITFTGNYVDLKLLAARRVIITGQGPGGKNTALLRGFTANGSYLSELMTSNLPYGVNVAAGEINGDGVDEIITGAGPGSKNPSLLKVFGRDGTLIAEFNPFEKNQKLLGPFSAVKTVEPGYNYGLNVTAGDIDGDGRAEIVVGSGSGPNVLAQVRVFSFDPLTGSLVDTGINFNPYPYYYGAKVAVGDVYGDGKAEIITAPGPGPRNPSDIKIWKVDTSGGMGNWKVTLSDTITAFAGSKYGANLAAGDVDGDGIAEIIVGAGPDPNGQSKVKVIKADKTVFSEFIVDESLYGVNVSAADIDGDGLDEIVTGSGPGPMNKATVRLFKGTGEPIKDSTGTDIVFDAYKTYYGVNISVGVILD